MIVTRDLDGFAALHAPEFIVNSPANRVIDGKTAARAFAAGMIDYSSFERRVEHAGKLPNGMVVIMGEEVLVPRGSAPNAGRTVRRRFTDLWRDDAGAWKLSVRQATIIDAVGNDAGELMRSSISRRSAPKSARWITGSTSAARSATDHKAPPLPSRHSWTRLEHNPTPTLPNFFLA